MCSRQNPALRQAVVGREVVVLHGDRFFPISQSLPMASGDRRGNCFGLDSSQTQEASDGHFKTLINCYVAKLKNLD